MVGSIRYVDGNPSWQRRVKLTWGDKAADHMHVADGYSIVAVADDELIGLISVRWRALPVPALGLEEAYIDLIEVNRDHRRQGIGRSLVTFASQRAQDAGVYQIRAWSSMDKIEAIRMWQSLGFALCPAVEVHGDLRIAGYFAVNVFD